MLVPFENMPGDSRIWIYQADRKLTEQEQAELTEAGNAFFEQWAAHGAPLKSSFRLFHDQFLVVTADEGYNMTSGCSIDSSVAFVKQLENRYQISFFDRTKIAFIFNEEVFVESLNNLKSSVNSGKITEDTLTFNNLISSKQELDTAWVVPAHTTWLGRYFN